VDFSWTEAQLALRDRVIAFARDELNGDLARRDRDGTFLRENWDKCAAFGVLGSFVPEAYGGRGMDLLTTVLMLEGLGYGCRDNGLTLGLNGQIWSVQRPILRFGTEQQRTHFLPRLCSGEWIGAHAITEPDAGSDVFALKTTARRVEGGYILDGYKSTIGMSAVADVAVVSAATNPERGSWGITMFLVQTEWSGVRRGPARPKMGLRTVPLGDIHFEGCFVPETHRLGPEGSGMSLFNASMDWERAFIFASHVGGMARQLDECIAFAKTRQQFGTTIGKFQAVSNRIADMRLRLETSRLLLYQLAWMKQADRPAGLESSLANLHLAECFAANSMDAVRTHGARGYLAEFEVERDLRDAVGGVIYAGTSDIQRNVIARILGL
jgi:alkylation response protein AidB-like acyl-CoA dehydrogenase